MNKTTTPIVIVLGILILGALAFFAVPHASAPGPEASSTSPTTTPASSGSVKPVVRSTIPAAPAIALSKVIKITGATVALYSGVNPAGDPVYTPASGVDGTTFKALTELATVEAPSEKEDGNAVAIGTGEAAYYADKTNIYILSVFTTSADTRVALERIDNADRATFVATKNVWYSKDKMNVYALEAPSTATPYTPGSYEWVPYDAVAITNVDVPSFVLASGSNYDAHDKAHTYRKGVVVGTYP